MAETSLNDKNRSRSIDSTEFQDEILDPRIQTELEKLNRASQTINSLEIQLNEARATFRQLLNESTARLDEIHKKVGSAVDKARPYYHARIRAKETQTETQNAAQRYERACSQLAAAKEMVFLAEQGFFCKGQPFDPAWQEMLNHATIKVNDAEEERLASEVEHRQTALVFNEAEQEVKHLQKELRRTISKSRPYFELKARVNQQMEDQKQAVSHLEISVQSAKQSYAEALNNLEQISDSIHRKRREESLRREMGTRGTGVGAESPDPPPSYEEVTSQSVVMDTGQLGGFSVKPSSSLTLTDSSQTPAVLISKDTATGNVIPADPELVAMNDNSVAIPSVSLTRNSPVEGETADSAFMSASLESNAEIMASLQRAKGNESEGFLSPRRTSHDDFDDGASDDSVSVASGTLLDDEQIESLMLEGGAEHYGRFLANMDTSDKDKWEKVSLPEKLSYLEDFVWGGDGQTAPVAVTSADTADTGKDDLMSSVDTPSQAVLLYQTEPSTRTQHDSSPNHSMGALDSKGDIEIMIVNAPHEMTEETPTDLPSNTAQRYPDTNELLEVIGKVTYV